MTTSPLNNSWAINRPWTQNGPWTMSNPRAERPRDFGSRFDAPLLRADEPRARRERRWSAGDERRPVGRGRDSRPPVEASEFEPAGGRRRGGRGPGRDGPSRLGLGILRSETAGGRGRGHVPGGEGPGGPGRGGGSHRGPRGWGDGPGGPRFGRGRKAGRGDIRAAVLVLLSEENMHGYQMIRELSERSGGAWRASPGSVYPTLQQLEDEGLIHTDASTGKRVFALTEAGRAHIAAVPAGTPAPWEALAEGKDTHELRELVGRLAAAVVQVDAAGTDAQRARTAELLKDARRAVYLVLAEDETTTA
jgi:DNA-binding PadR family transcriptional regulator